jgi:hypothetical protein
MGVECTDARQAALVEIVKYDLTARNSFCGENNVARSHYSSFYLNGSIAAMSLSAKCLMSRNPLTVNG